MLSCGRRARRSSKAGAWNTAIAPTTTAVITKIAHATRHCVSGDDGDRTGNGDTPARPRADRRPHGVPFLGSHLARDDVGVRRERHARRSTGDDDADGQGHHRMCACDDAHPDGCEQSGTSDCHPRTPPGEHRDHADVGCQVGEVGRGRDKTGRARGHLDLGAHVRQQQAVAVAGEAEGDRDHRGSREQCARRRLLRRDRPSRCQACWVLDRHGVVERAGASTGGARVAVAEPARMERRLPTCRQAGDQAAQQVLQLVPLRCSQDLDGRGQGLVACSKRSRGTTSSRRRQAKSPFPRVRRGGARDQTRSDQPVDEPGRPRARETEDIAEPGDRAVRMGQQGHQRGMVGRGQASGVRLVDQAVGNGQREGTHEVLQTAHATILQYLTDAGK